MKIILLFIMAFLVSCGKGSDVKTHIPHDEGPEYTGLRWAKNDFPLKIVLPCTQDTTDSLYPFMNCNQILEQDRADFITVRNQDTGDHVIESIKNAMDEWNNALDFEAFQLEVSGTNVDYNNSPVEYLKNAEYSKKRIAFIKNWFSAMSNSNPDKPGSNVLAITIYSYSQSTKRLLDADILFNVKNFSYINHPTQADYNNLCSTNYSGDQNSCNADERCAWANNSCKASPKYSGNMHFQSVLVHELGHFLGMEHISSSNENSIMNPSLNSEQIKSTLTTKDKCRINQRYRDIFTTCDAITAEDKFCYDLTNVNKVDVDEKSKECKIMSCNEGFKLNSLETACLPN